MRPSRRRAASPCRVVGLRTTESANAAAGAGAKCTYWSNRCGPNRPLPAAISVTDASADVLSSEPVPPPFTNSRSATSRTAATAATAPVGEFGDRAALDGQRTATPRTLDAGLLARPAICASYPIMPTSVKPGRETTTSASARAASGVCTGDR